MRRSPAALLAIAAVVWIAVSGAPAAASVSVVMPTYPYIIYPYVPLNTDPGDAERPVGEQDVVFQCDPAWGPDECPPEGIDLRNVEASVLLQMYPGLRDTARDLLVGRSARCRCRRRAAPARSAIARGGVYYPYLSTEPVPRREMAALSWNFMMMLITHQAPVDPENPAPDEPDPDDPMSTQPQQCSFAQPQFCASVIQFLPEPGAGARTLTALLALAALPRPPIALVRLLLPRAIDVPEIAPRRDAVAHQALQLRGLREAARVLARPDQRVADADLEDAARAGHQRHAREIGLEGAEQLLREPRRAQQPAALGAVGDADRRAGLGPGHRSRGYTTFAKPIR